MVLITTVINGITNFCISAFIFAKAFTDEIDSLCGKFLWKENCEAQSLEKVARSSCCKSKKMKEG